MNTVKQQSKKKRKGHRDYSHYLYHGKRYGKGTLVHAVIRDYVDKHPNVTAEKLQELFPRKEFHSPFEIVEKIKEAKAGRFFLKTDSLINTANARVAVTNQWGSNIDYFIDFVKKNMHVKIQRARA